MVEQDQILWIWMGDPALADPKLIVHHPWHNDPGWIWIKDRYSINANDQLITDKLMDLTHVGYVHQRTIGGTPQAHLDAETKTTRSETGVKVTRWVPNSVPPPAYVAAFKFNTPQQASIDRQGGVPLVMIASDAGLVHARRLVETMIENEAKASVLANKQQMPVREIQEQTS